jgi:chemotaxis signal transduction protein
MDSLNVFSPESTSPQPPWSVSAPASSPNPTPTTRGLALFRLRNNWLGVDIEHIERVVPLDYVTWLSMDSGLIMGTVGLHGRLFPVVDLPAILGQGPSKLPAQGVILVSRAGDTEIGILADELGDVFIIPESRIQEPGSESLPHAVTGHFQCGNREVRIIDPLRIVETLRERQEVLSA